MGRKTPENAKEWLERYREKANRAFRNYQNSGDPRYDRQIWEYESICSAFEALLERREERNTEMQKRIRNKDWMIEHQLLDMTYTREEVIKMLNDAVYW